MKTVKTVRFGPLTYRDEDVIRFESGLIGLPGLRDWIMLDMDGGVPMKWLQSLDRDDFGVPVMEPGFFAAEYEPRIPGAAWDAIGATMGDDTVLLVITTVHPGGERITGNLMAPLVVDAQRRRGAQVALDSDAYPVRQELDYLKFGLAVASASVDNAENRSTGEKGACPEDAAVAETLEVEL